MYFVNETGMVAVAARLDAAVAATEGANRAIIVYLQGPLGAGKTTLVRALLRRWGESGAVRSPTYTLIEPYMLGSRAVFHLDLYRIVDAEELEYLGLREIITQPQTVCLIEWPERAQGALPPAHITITIGWFKTRRKVQILISPNVLLGTSKNINGMGVWGKGPDQL